MPQEKIITKIIIIIKKKLKRKVSKYPMPSYKEKYQILKPLEKPEIMLWKKSSIKILNHISKLVGSLSNA